MRVRSSRRGGQVVVVAAHTMEEALAVGASGTSVQRAASKQDNTWPVVIITSNVGDAPVLVFTRAEWTAFSGGVKNNDFEEFEEIPSHRRRYLAVATLAALAIWLGWRAVHRRPAHS